jgi:hypothetical protein
MIELVSAALTTDVLAACKLPGLIMPNVWQAVQSRLA